MLGFARRNVAKRRDRTMPGKGSVLLDPLRSLPGRDGLVGPVHEQTWLVVETRGDLLA